MPTSIIAVIGGLNVDLVTVTDRLPETGETINSISFSRHLGGKGANSAVAAYRVSHKNPALESTIPTHIPHEAHQRFSYSDGDDDGEEEELEISVRMLGAVGDDEFGRPCIEKLRQTGVNVSGIRTMAGQHTGVAVIIVEADYGENRILTTPGANLALLPTDFLTFDSLAGGVWPDLLIAQLEIPRETIERILETASHAGVDVLLNPAPAQVLLSTVYPMITHLVVNETEAALLSGRFMREIETPEGWASVTDQFLEMGVKNVVVTLGAKGAYYSCEIGKGGHVEAEKGLDVVDTTGAG
jgi:ribokinase